MKDFYVEFDDSAKSMDFKQISSLMRKEDIPVLIEQLQDSYSIPLVLADGRKAQLRQASLLPPPEIEEDDLPTFQVTLSTSIPVSARVYVYAKDQSAAENTVKIMINENRLNRSNVPNLEREIQEEIYSWVQGIESDDWIVGDAVMTKEDYVSETLS